MKYQTYRIIIIFLFSYLLCGHAFAGQKMKAKEKDATAEKGATLVLPIQFYQAHMSKVDGDRCQMEPSCSAFCVDALKKHGFLLGWIMCSDRLVRCGRDEEKVSATIRINHKTRIYDPVGNNDFWWQNPK
jgi:uncharacterized protein